MVFFYQNMPRRAAGGAGGLKVIEKGLPEIELEI